MWSERQYKKSVSLAFIHFKVGRKGNINTAVFFSYLMGYYKAYNEIRAQEVSIYYGKLF